MIVTETRILNGRTFYYSYSDSGMMIERDGSQYSEAYDPKGSGRTYIETDALIETNTDDSGTLTTTEV